MRQPDPIGVDAREAAHRLRLGPLPHVCMFCGYTDPLALKAKPLEWVEERLPPSVLEAHHVVGHEHDGNLIVLLCASCHLLVHRRYLDFGVDLRFEPDPTTRVVRMLEARATFSELDAQCFRQMAELLNNRKDEDADEGKDH